MSVSGSYMGYKASLQVDVKKFKESMSDKTKFGENKQVLTSGGVDMPEPIAIKLVPIDVALRPVFYTSLRSISSERCSLTDSVLETKRKHVQKALVDYPTKKGAIQPVGECSSPPVLLMPMDRSLFVGHSFNLLQALRKGSRPRRKRAWTPDSLGLFPVRQFGFLSGSLERANYILALNATLMSVHIKQS